LRSFCFDADKCDLCRKCEDACMHYLQSKKINHFISPIRIVMSNEKPFLAICRQCEDAPCVDACIARAMQRDEKTDFVLHNPDQCVGCMMCNLVCPWGMPTPLYSQKKILKCSGSCGAQKHPCIDVCDRDALSLKDTLNSIKKRRRIRCATIPVEKIRK